MSNAINQVNLGKKRANLTTSLSPRQHTAVSNEYTEVQTLECHGGGEAWQLWEGHQVSSQNDYGWAEREHLGLA